MIVRLLGCPERKGGVAMFARFPAMAGAFNLVAGCVTKEDGSTASIFSDLEAIMPGGDVSEEQGALRDQAESDNDDAEARVASAVAGGIIDFAAGDEEGALLGAVAGGVAGYIGGSYLASEPEALSRDGRVEAAEARRLEHEQSDLVERIDALLGDG